MKYGGIIARGAGFYKEAGFFSPPTRGIRKCRRWPKKAPPQAEKNSDETGREEIEKLKEAGFDDAAIVDRVSVTAYFNFINRVARGLGVYLDEPLRARADPGELREEMARLEGKG